MDVLGLVVAMAGEMFDRGVIGFTSRLRQTIHAFLNFDVDEALWILSWSL